MLATTTLRALRLKYHISLSELAKQGGVSNQHFSRLELGTVRRTIHREQLVEAALLGVIAARRAALVELEKECQVHRKKFLTPTEENRNEL